MDSPKDHLKRALWGTAGVLGFVVLVAVAMALYPLDARGAGYSFFFDYWCDLFDPVTASGLVNPGSWWAVAATTSLALGLVPLFWSLRRSRCAWITGAGLVGCSGLVIVPVVTGLGLLDYHGWFILLTGPPGLLGVVLAVIEQRRRGESAAAWAGAGLLVLGGWNFLQYSRQLVGGAERWSGLPAVQKLATLALLIWMLVSLWNAPRPHVGK